MRLRLSFSRELLQEPQARFRHVCPLASQCELDIMFNLEKAHFILDEMVMNGCIIETNKNNILAPVHILDKTAIS